MKKPSTVPSPAGCAKEVAQDLHKPHPDGGSYLWWANVAKLEAHFTAHGNYDTLVDPALKKWAQTTQKALGKESYTDKQHEALIRIHFRLFMQSDANKIKRSGSKLDRARELIPLVAGGSATEEEAAECRRLLTMFRTKFGNGELSEKTARELGLNVG